MIYLPTCYSQGVPHWQVGTNLGPTWTLVIVLRLDVNSKTHLGIESKLKLRDLRGVLAGEKCHGHDDGLLH